MPPKHATDSPTHASMEKSLNETADGAPDNRPASLSKSVVAQEPENIQTDGHHPVESNPNDESCVQYVTGFRLAAITSAVTLTAFLITLDTSIISTATPKITSHMLIVGRAIAGMGSAGVGNGALTIVSASVPLEKRACFYVNLPIGGIAIAALLWVAVPNIPVEKPKRTTFNSLFHELDLAGCLLFAPTMTMFLLALEWGGSTYPWGSATIIGLFCGSVANLALFLIWEHKKGDSAMIPFKMVKKRVVSSAGFNIFFLFANNVITPYYLAIYFQGVRGTTPTLSGVYMLPGILGQMVCGILGGLAVTRMGYYLPWAVFGSGLTAIGSGLISRFTQQTNTGIWIGYQIIGGVGRGLALQMPFVAVQNNLPASEIAVSMAFLSFCRNFGGALLLSFAEIVFNRGLGHALPRYAPGLSLDQVTALGVSGIRSIIPQTSAEGVISAYVIAIQNVFYLVAGTAAAAFIFSAGLGWKSVKKANQSRDSKA
ncbi:hypothetical protein NHQ30_010834 [Ciborinia camelliae]|nr:hypothetical protein NHQ30_010834 [Ciborinia camelliae]